MPQAGHAPRLVAGLNVCLDCHRLSDESRCEIHRKTKRAAETIFSKGLYGRPWRRATAAWMAEDPENRTLCVMCLAEGRSVKGDVTDHIVPHRGDLELYWDRSNWQRLCLRHHGLKTALESFGNDRSDRT